MEKKVFSKKLLLLIIALFLMGFFVWYIWTYELNKTNPPNPEPDKKADERFLPNSAIYNRDLVKGTMTLDEGGTWQNQDFTRYIYDSVPGGSELGKCFYYVYDHPKKIFSAGGERKCNSNLTVTVGEGKDCSSQGENACSLHVYAKDKNGNEGNTMMDVYNIDSDAPVVGKVFTKDNETYPIKVGKGEKKTYKAEVSDTLSVGYCWFFFDSDYVPVVPSPSPCENGKKCIVSAEHSFEEGETHNVFVRCADRYSAEAGNYFNASDGEAVQISVSINHAPEISSCKVNPTQGTTSTDFKFEVQATDPDGDARSFNWDFGDGNYSSEESPTHNYKNKGTYEPKVTVSDDRGLQDTRSTAWVSVSE